MPEYRSYFRDSEGKIRGTQILDCEDDKLWRWFMGYEVCPDAELTALIARIRALPA